MSAKRVGVKQITYAINNVAVKITFKISRKKIAENSTIPNGISTTYRIIV